MAMKFSPNPVTGGFETVNPDVGVNTGMYSVENKVKRIKDMGYQVRPGMEKTGFESIMDAFSRDPNAPGGMAVNEEIINKYFYKPSSPTGAVYGETSDGTITVGVGKETVYGIPGGSTAGMYNGSSTPTSPGGGVPTAPEVKNPWEQALEDARRNASEAEARAQAARDEAEKIRNASASSQLEAGVIPTTPGATSGQPAEGETGFGAFVGGTMSERDKYIQDSGYGDLFKAQDDELKRLGAMLKDGTLSDAERNRLKAIYDSANKVLEAQKTSLVEQLRTQKSQTESDWNAAINRQKDTNARILENAEKMAALTGASFSTGGMTGLQSVIQQGQDAINELETKKANALSAYQTKIDETTAVFAAKIEENNANFEKAVADKYADTVAAMNKVIMEKGKASAEVNKELREMLKDYLDFQDKAAGRAMEANKFELDKAKFAWDADFKSEKEERDYYTKIFENAFKEGNLYGMKVSEVDALNIPDEMKLLIKGGIVRDTISALNEYGESVGYGDIGTKYAEDIRKGIASGMSSADIVATISDKLNLPLMPKEKDSERTIVHNLGGGKALIQRGDQLTEFDMNKKVATMKRGGILSSIGTGTVTGYGGAYDGFKGLDIDGKIGDPISGFSGTVVSAMSHPMYGNTVVIRDNDGNEIRLSHLDSVNVQPGQKFTETDIIGSIGNTGNVTAGPGGDGSHLDIRIKRPGDAEEMSSKSVEQFLRDYGKGDAGEDVIGPSGIPIAYESKVMSYLPASMKSGEAEQKRLIEKAVAFYESGMSAEEAALQAIGVTVPKSKMNEFMGYMNVGAMLGDVMPGNYYSMLEKFVNKGDKTGANNYVEGLVDAAVKKLEGAEAVTSATMRSSQSTVDKILELAEKNKSKIGPVSGRISNIDNKLKGDPDYQALKTLLTQYVGKIRHDLAGSAVTATEIGALEDYIQLTTDVPFSTLIAKLKTIQSTIRGNYDSQRARFAIPKGTDLGDDAIDAWMRGETTGGGDTTDNLF